MLCLLLIMLMSIAINAQSVALDYETYDYEAMEDAEPCRTGRDCRLEPSLWCRCVWGRCVFCGGPKQKKKKSTKSYRSRLLCDYDEDCSYLGTNCWCVSNGKCSCLVN